MNIELDEHVVRQVLSIRYYLRLAQAQNALAHDPARFAAINLLHEAFESTLIVCAQALNADVNARTSIDGYLNSIDQAISPKKLPFRTRILQFNRARVSAKHALIIPDLKEQQRYFEIVPEFIREAISLVFKSDLEKINLVDLIANDEVRGCLLEAQAFAATADYFDALVRVRRAFYLLIEKDYDVSVFEGRDPLERYGVLDSRSMCKSPNYARSTLYIQESVRSPTDYIVFDHARVEADCLKWGFETLDLWNVWRLTPAVWRRPSGEWVNEFDMSIAYNNNSEPDFWYCLDSVTYLALRIESFFNSARYGRPAIRSIGVRPCAPLRRFARSSAPIDSYLPPHVQLVGVSGAVPSLDENASYWQVFHLEMNGPFISGFLHAEDAVGEPFEAGMHF